jgi:hypothetical protein
VLPVLQLAAEELREKALPPDILAANVDNFFLISGLPHCGQRTSPITLALRTSSSNGCLHLLQTNSNNGIYFSFLVALSYPAGNDIQPAGE